MAQHGVIASASSLASQAGLEILEKGGNAVDAAIATGIALAVTFPRAGNIGGGGFMVVRLATGATTVIDYRERAPASASRNMFLDAKGDIAAGRSTAGYLASGVPGTISGFALAHERYGSRKVTWAELVEPARRLASEGFPVSKGLAQDFRASTKELSRFPESKRIYLRDGRLYTPGERWVQSELAATLKRLQEKGPREFYEGETAERIAADMAANGGLITREDLRNYQAVERTPLRGRYRGYEIITAPPPSSGGIALLQMLAILERFDVRQWEPKSPEKIHLFAEVMRRAFRDRALYLGDPDFVDVPVSGLLDPAYTQWLMNNYDPAHATPSERLDTPRPREKAALTTVEIEAAAKAARTTESSETTHFSVVDRDGNVVSNTYTLNGYFGSGVTIPGTGIVMNNEMDDFTSKVGEKNLFGLIQGEANAIAPNKRPLSSMTPSIVLKDGKPLLATGSPGGPTIINTTLLMITNVIDHGMTVTDAVNAPRFHHQWIPDVINYEPALLSPKSRKALETRGHVFELRTLYPNDPEGNFHRWGDAESISVDPKTQLRIGVSDERNSDSGSAGY